MGADGKGKLVLLVEDHDDSRYLAERVLTRLGYRVVAAATAAEARGLAAAARPDVVLADVGLPDVDGCDLMRELRARYGVPGVAMTGYVSEADVERCRQAGFHAHVTKPAGIDDIGRALAAALATPDRRDREPGPDAPPVPAAAAAAAPAAAARPSPDRSGTGTGDDVARKRLALRGRLVTLHMVLGALHGPGGESLTADERADFANMLVRAAYDAAALADELYPDVAPGTVPPATPPGSLSA